MPVRWHQPILYLWAAPATLLGLLPIPIALVQGGSCQVVRGVVEVHGGLITTLLRVGLPWVGSGAELVGFASDRLSRYDCSATLPAVKSIGPHLAEVS